MTRPICCRYAIEYPAFTIAAVSGDWDAFSEQNDAPHLTAEVVQGSCLWDHIASAEVRHLYALLCKEVLQRKRPIEYYFRCDGPHMQRYLLMRLAPGQNSTLAFETEVVWEKRASTPLFSVNRECDDRLLSVCSICKRIDCGEAWCEVESAIDALKIFDGPRMPGLSHTLCPACYHGALRKLP